MFINKITPLKNINLYKPSFQCNLPNEHQDNNKTVKITNIRYAPVNFSNINALENKLMSLENLHCPVCGVKTLSNEKFDKIINTKCDTGADLVNLFKENKKNIPPTMKDLVRRISSVAKSNPSYSAVEVINTVRNNLKSDENLFVSSIKGLVNLYAIENNFDEYDFKLLDAIYDNIYSFKNKEKTYAEAKGAITANIDMLSTSNKDQIYKIMNRSLKKMMTERYCLNVKNVEELSDDERVKNFLSKIYKGTIKDLTHLDASNGIFGNEPVAICSDCAHSRHSIINSNLSYEHIAKNFANYFIDILYCDKVDDDLKAHILKVKQAMLIISQNGANFSKLTSPKYNKIKSDLFDLQSSSSNFNIVNQQGVHCAACNIETVTYQQKKELRKQIDEAKDLHAMREIYMTNKKQVSPHYKGIMKNFEKILVKNPNISETEMLKQLRNIYNDKANKSISRINYAVNEALYSPKCTPKERLIYEKYLSETENIYNENEEVFPLTEYNDIFKRTLSNISNNKHAVVFYREKANLWDVWLKQIILYPSTEFVRNKNSILREMIFLMFARSSATATHLVSRKNGGSDTQDNLIVLCADCTRNKQNRPTNAWLDGNVESNLQKYILEMDEIIKSNNLSEYSTYLEKLVENVKRATNNRVNLKMPEDA